jgi:hypothetical protein
MKIFTLVFLTVFYFSEAVFAQPTTGLNERSLIPNDPYPFEQGIRGHSSYGNNHRSNVYFEDFDGGLPAEWTLESLAGSVVWEWINQGFSGPFPTHPLWSTSAANGWMVIGLGLDDPLNGVYQHCTAMSPSINCSGYEAVRIKFEQYYASHGSEPSFVEVSVDEGLTWVTYILHEGLSQGGTPNPDIVEIDITDIAANEMDVQVRFRWESYGFTTWQIDDFSIIAPDDNDMVISNMRYQDLWIAADEVNFRDLEYSVYPLSQIRPFNLSATGLNYGTELQTGVRLQVELSDGFGYSETLLSNSVDLMPQEFYNFQIPYTPPAVVGNYTIQYTIIQDQVDDFVQNNIGWREFQISESEYALDLGHHEFTFGSIGGNYKTGNAFFMEVQDSIYCVGIALANTSIPGSYYNFELKEIENNELIDLSSSMVGQVPSVNELNAIGDGNFIWTSMSAPIFLDENTDYAVFLNCPENPENVKFATSGNVPPSSNFYYLEEENQWYYLTRSPMIRMGLSEEFCASLVTNIVYEGCMDTLALNYNALANVEDGSCYYPYPEECSISYDTLPFYFDVGDILWVVLNYSSTGNNEFYWDFGDGNSSTETYPIHIYDQDGDYQVCVSLSVTDDMGELICADQYCDTLSSNFFTGLVERPMQGHRQNGFTINVINPLSVSVSEMKLNNNFTLFPNPTTGLLNVMYSGSFSNSPTIQFYDISGRLLQSEVIPVLNDSQQLVFDISELPAGIYFVSIESASGRETHKLLKQ